jgi:hypothetical protein
MKNIYLFGLMFFLLFIATFSGYVHGYESGREEGRILQMQEDYLSDSLNMRMELDNQLQEAIKDIPR